MSKEMERPKVSKSDSPVADTVETHPAYGQIGANRVSGHAQLYGSDFQHQNFVTIQISESVLNRGLSRDWSFARKELIKVALSEAQWAAFVSTLNSGMGVQCTIDHVGHVPRPAIQRDTNRKAQFGNELVATLSEANALAKKLEQMIEHGGKKSEMRDAIIGLRNSLTPNLAFVADQFGEHMEQITEQAKIEVNAYVEGRIQAAGLKALGAEPVISLPISEESKP